MQRLKKRREQVIQSIYNDIDPRMIREESKYIADRMEELEAEESQHQDKPPLKPLVHPTMAHRYRQQVENLRQTLERSDCRAEAAGHLRALIGKIVLTPVPGRNDLQIDLHGDLAGILQIASQKRVRPGKTLDLSASGPNK
ncbi:MAG: hypothetical protein HC801_05895 [Nitrospira sp.]|nr:hypothetical protein [Nitrospira sp.]